MSTKLSRAWLSRALDAEARIYRTRRAVLRRKHRQATIDALMVAASLGERDAFLKLGICYMYEDPGVTPDQPEIAEHWFRLGAAAKDTKAMVALGELLIDLGRQPEGRRWLKKALAQGNPDAACQLGSEIEETSPSRALRWYLKGVALGDRFATYCAGRLLEERGARADLLEAAKMYQKAARKRIPGAAAGFKRVRHLLREEGPRRSA